MCMTKSVSFILLFCCLFFLVSADFPSKQIRFPILYVDMDGTTLGSDHKIRPATLVAFDKYKQCGGLLGVASGRTLEQVAPYLDDIQPNLPLVLANGSAVLTENGNQVITQSTLTKNTLELLLANQNALDGLQGIFLRYLNHTISDRATPQVKTYATTAKFTINETCRIEECVLKQMENNSNLAPLKVELLVAPEEFARVVDKLKNVLGKQATVVLTNPSAAVVEIVPVGINKQVAIEKVVSQKGFTLNDVVYFGDSQNDAEILGAVSLGIAMQNCHPDSCQAATFVTGNNDTDAIANVIKRLIIKESCQ